MAVVTAFIPGSASLREVAESVGRKQEEMVAAVAMLRPDLAVMITERLAIAERSLRFQVPARPGRKLVEVLCCPQCQGTEMTKEACRRGRNFWRCADADCGHRWKEPKNAGKRRAALA